MRAREKITTDMAFKNLQATDKDQNIATRYDGLFVRIRSKKSGGGVSFRLVYRIEGKQLWITLEEKKSLKLAEAERQIYLTMISQGIDPALERKLKVERERTAQLAEQAALAKQQALISVANLFERWVNTDLQKRKDLAEIRRMFEKDVLPIIGSLVVADVRKGHITEVTDKLKQRGVNHLARNLLKLMRQMFRFAVDRDIIEFDPTASLSVTKTTAKPTERDRVLSEDEIRQLKIKMPDAGFMPSTECAIWIMLSTCCRVGELSKARWKHVDFAAQTFFITAENSKNGKAHTIYLSEFALSQFQRLAEVRQSEIWLLPNRSNTSHVCDKSLSKQVDGRQNPVIHRGRTSANTSLMLPGGKWTPHDLRRSGATLMGNLGVHGDVIEKCLNHKEENKLKRVYQHQKLESEQARAWRLLGDRLELLTGNSTNVITFGKAGQA
ncbi:site-specific integrase [Methylobacter sp.]|uniref:tyrosine-type recombinase/integrase n=1 Tax=Methylobacter sp. TaxID=2051955 RepID=UPI0024887BCB|nr:site-specific integrase [Methylobacter sp.]MDI1276706.1 tyrosine-type recombinase/integrase [Methylobacter sp.]MDI1357374.1 tyrosine-type recombinase/integrase [Methylobacter sp.]